MRLSLFWRTFLLIATLIIASVLGALQLVREFDRSPPDQQLAWELASIVNLTRSALVNSRGERRQQLLAELAREEGVTVIPLEPGDRVESLATLDPDAAALARSVQSRLSVLLGHPTQLAGKVNGESGLWLNFEIDGDGYWLELTRERFSRQTGPNWTLIGLMTLSFSILGALGVSQLVNRPLARLAAALGRMSRGEAPGRLPEAAPTEIAEVNRRFNRMASDLAQLDADRELTLAGISHDIRTPLARLKLEIELSAMAEADKASMGEDIDRIDRIVGQFVEFGRSAQSDRGRRVEDVDLLGCWAGLESAYRTQIAGGALSIAATIAPDARWRGVALDLVRILANLVENALRYGRTPGSERADVQVGLRRIHRELIIEVADAGPGVPESDHERMLRPFTRLETARTGDGGSGLGLAIVARIARRYDGDCRLARAPQGGLQVTVRLRDASSAPQTPPKEPNS
jgi:two-component system osmolarity sensor histidine kinase EnvZ